jgi:hypothetical protein
MNVDHLHNQEIHFKSKTKSLVQIGGREYEMSVSKEKSALNLLLPNQSGKTRTGSLRIAVKI